MSDDSLLQNTIEEKMVVTALLDFDSPPTFQELRIHYYFKNDNLYGHLRSLVRQGIIQELPPYSNLKKTSDLIRFKRCDKAVILFGLTDISWEEAKSLSEEEGLLLARKTYEGLTGTNLIGWL